MKFLAALLAGFQRLKHKPVVPTSKRAPVEPLSLEHTKISEESIRAIVEEYGYSFELWTKPDGCIYRFVKLYEIEERQKMEKIEEEMEVW